MKIKMNVKLKLIIFFVSLSSIRCVTETVNDMRDSMDNFSIFDLIRHKWMSAMWESGSDKNETDNSIASKIDADDDDDSRIANYLYGTDDTFGVTVGSGSLHYGSLAFVGFVAASIIMAVTGISLTHMYHKEPNSHQQQPYDKSMAMMNSYPMMGGSPSEFVPMVYNHHQYQGVPNPINPYYPQPPPGAYHNSGYLESKEQQQQQQQHLRPIYTPSTTTTTSSPNIGAFSSFWNVMDNVHHKYYNTRDTPEYNSPPHPAYVHMNPYKTKKK